MTTTIVATGQVRSFARTRLAHGGNHAGCSGIVSVKADLWFEDAFTGCTTGVQDHSFPIATNSNTNHDKAVSKTCTVYFCSSQYRAKGYHYFDSNLFESKVGNPATGGCGGPACNPCTPGYYEGGSCNIPQQDACGCCPDPSPLIIDRSGNGLLLSRAEDGALFDINGYRSMFWLGWPTSGDDAWLAMDRNGNGVIDDGSELFGNTRVLKSGVNAKHGYEVLAELDDNLDGVIDSHDPQYSRLLLWGDVDRNGVSEPRELVGIAAAGIRSLTLDYRESRRHDRWGNQFRYLAVDGSTVDVFPVWKLPDSSLEGLPE